MTNQEAIKILREKVFPCLITGEWTEAIGMAIAALEAQDAPDINVGTSKYTVSATAVEEMLKDLLPERGMWEIEGDEAKTAICETVHDALEGLWKLPLAHPEQDCMLKQFGNCSYAETGCSDCAIKAKIRRALSSEQPETHEERTETLACDLIERCAAIDAIESTDWYHINTGGELVHGANSKEDEPLYKAKDIHSVIENLPPAQPALTAEEWKLVKQLRSYHNGSYAQLLDKLIAAASQPAIIHCRDCKYYYFADNSIPQEQRYTCDLDGDRWPADSFCSFAERREE